MMPDEVKKMICEQMRKEMLERIPTELIASTSSDCLTT